MTVVFFLQGSSMQIYSRVIQLPMHMKKLSQWSKFHQGSMILAVVRISMRMIVCGTNSTSRILWQLMRLIVPRASVVLMASTDAENI